MSARPSIVRALAAQLIAFALCFGAALAVNRNAEANVPFTAVLAASGLLAAFIGSRFGLAIWWLPVQLFLPVALFAALKLNLPTWFYAVGFAGLWLVFWNASGERVPLYLSNKKTWAALLKLIPAGTDLRFIDLGAGIGGTGLHLAKSRSGLLVEAVETAPLPFAIAWLRHQLFAPPNAKLSYANLWECDLGAYDVVYCFLSTAPMPALMDKARREMKPGALLVSNSFAVPGISADEIVEVDDGRRTKLHVWRI